MKHQSRHFTEGSVWYTGYWVTGAKSLVASFVFNCVKCCRHRGRCSEQKMTDLPSDRVVEFAPFSHVGVDVCGL